MICRAKSRGRSATFKRAWTMRLYSMVPAWLGAGVLVTDAGGVSSNTEQCNERRFRQRGRRFCSWLGSTAKECVELESAVA